MHAAARKLRNGTALLALVLGSGCAPEAPSSHPVIGTWHLDTFLFGDADSAEARAQARTMIIARDHTYTITADATGNVTERGSWKTDAEGTTLVHERGTRVATRHGESLRVRLPWDSMAHALTMIWHRQA